MVFEKNNKQEEPENSKGLCLDSVCDKQCNGATATASLTVRDNPPS